jgi:uracil-DNA glycosylase family protein
MLKPAPSTPPMLKLAPFNGAFRNQGCRVSGEAMARTPTKPSRSSPDDPVPPARSIEGLAEAARACQACPLFANATQAVFGEGPASARLVLVGEQPGNEEDLSGHPFVGPAGAVLEKALAEAGIDRRMVYVTNAVKHFSWEPRGKRRIHKKPRISEIKACHPWLGAELARIKPAVTVCMGTSAVQSLLGPKVTIGGAKGQVFDSVYGPVLVTRHPSSVLRLREKEERRAAIDELVHDLRRAAKLLL